MTNKEHKNAPVETVEPKTSEAPTNGETSNVLTAEPKRPLVDSLRETLTLVSAGASVFVVLFYLAGRSFTGGYFGVMNIPIYMVSFSLLEYGEVAWIPLFLFPLLIIIGLSSFIFAVFVLRDLLWPPLARLLEKTAHKKGGKQYVLHFPKISKETQRSSLALIWASVVFLVMVMILSMMTLTDAAGRKAGQNTVLHSQKVELISTIPLSLDDNALAPVKASRQDYYIYKGFHLLTFNDGKYYLFKEIDPVTCKPLKVYIVNPEKALQINLSAAESLADQCQITNPPTGTATHIPQHQSTPTP
jgi:hypothetical protein